MRSSNLTWRATVVSVINALLCKSESLSEVPNPLKCNPLVNPHVPLTCALSDELKVCLANSVDNGGVRELPWCDFLLILCS